MSAASSSLISISIATPTNSTCNSKTLGSISISKTPNFSFNFKTNCYPLLRSSSPSYDAIHVEQNLDLESESAIEEELENDDDDDEDEEEEVSEPESDNVNSVEQIGGRTMKVNFPEVTGPKIRSSNREFIESPHKMYAGNLSRIITTEKVKDAFVDHPGPSGTKVIYEKHSGRSRDFGFVTFSSPEAAESSLSAMNGVVEELRTNGFAYDPPPNHHLPPSSKTTLISPKPSPPPPPPPPPITATTNHLQEKILYLDSIGIDLIPLLTTHPPLITTPLSHIKSTISFLSTTIPLPPAALNRLISLTPEILTLPLPSIISTITFLLREAHVRRHHLRHVIHRRPRLLTSDVKTRLRPTMYFLQGTIGISEVNKHAHLLSSSVEDKLIPRIEYFHENIGIKYDDTIVIFRRFPSLFCYSIKENLEPKYNYFVAEMGRDLKELVEFPQYFSFSLENRIKPRHLRCVEKGVCLPLPAMLRSSENRFMERLEVCCDSSMPMRNSPFWNYKLKNSDYY